MIGGRASNWVVGLGFAIFFAIGVLMWFTHYWDFSDLCGPNEGSVECFRTWFGASAGYLAAVAAGATLFALFAQVREQRKQTDFLVGDALPTMDVSYDLSDPEQLVIRIANWNRRGMLLIMLNVDGLDGASWGLMETKLGDNVVKDPDDFARSRYLRGWENRSGPPAVMQFKIAASRENKMVRNWPKTTVVRCGVHLISERPRRVTLTGYLHPEDHHFSD